MVDAHYTPLEIADEMADLLHTGLDRPAIADFAAGHGALLEAVERRFPRAQISASDIDGAAVSHLRQRHAQWNVGKCDFFNAKSRAASGIAGRTAHYDAIVLNPPYSFRGLKGQAFRTQSGFTGVGSPAASFVLMAADRLSNTGELLALVPSSTLDSEKDSALWEYIESRWNVEPVRSFGRSTFHGLAARTTLVRVGGQPTLSPTYPRIAMPVQDPDLEIELIRGCTPVHQMTSSSSEQGLVAIHTTGLTRHGIRVQRVDKPKRGRYVRGPAVLLPRVGAPVLWKVQTYADSSALLLSDCVIALGCATPTDAYEAHRRLASRWTDVTVCWAGSCAPYITIARLRDMLARLGIRAFIGPVSTLRVAPTADLAEAQRVGAESHVGNP